MTPLSGEALRAHHHRFGAISGIPQCCIDWFCNDWERRHGYTVQRKRTLRWHAAHFLFRAYRRLVPGFIQFFPCPKHLILEIAQISKIRERFHQWPGGFADLGKICARCGATFPSWAGCKNP